MLLDYKIGQTSVVLRVKIRDSTVSTGAGKTGLTSASSGLIISTIADNEATATAYTVAGSTIETITTLGTYASPTATKCRFKEVDSTNHKGIYEIQIADARFAVSSAKSLLISISGATGAAECDVVIPLRQVDPYDAVRAGLTALPNVASGNAGAIITSGTGTAQLSVSSGRANADVLYWNAAAVATPDTAGYPKVTVKSGTGTGELSLSSGQVILQSGTGTGQLDFTSGVVKANATQWLGGTIPAVNTTGVPKVDLILWLGTAPLALSSQQVQAVVPVTQKVDIETIKTQAVTCAAGVTVGAFVGQGTAAIGVNASGHVSRVVLCDTITTYTGDTPQTGDSYAIVNSGTHGNAAIKGYVDDIGTAGAGLTAVPWNAAWDAEVQSEVQDAIEANNLDHLVKIAVDTDWATTVHLNSVVGHLADNGTTATFDRTTDSQEAIRDRGDAAWITATGFSTHTAADVWTSGTRTLTSAANITSTGGTVTVSSGSVSVYDFTTAAKALLQTEAEDALVTHRLDELLNADSDIDGAAPPTVGSVFHELMTKTTGSFTYDQTTDSLEAVRDRGDAAWTTATGFSTLDAAGIRTAVGLASANLDTQLSTIDTVVDTILVDTNELQTDWVNGGRLDLILDARASQITQDIMYGSLVSATGAVTTGATATVIPTNMSPTANSYNDQLLVFTSGNLAGRAMPILSNTSGGVFTMGEAFHAAPSDGSAFNITPSHVHPVSQIAAAVRDVDNGDGVAATGSLGEVCYAAMISAAEASGYAQGTRTDTQQLLASQVIDTTKLNNIKTDTAAILLDTGTDGVVVASGSKTGYSLSSTGLDSVATTAPSGVASNFREMLVQVWRRFFKKSTLTSTQLKTYADDGTTVVTTQTVSDDGSTQTQGTSS